MDKLNPTSLNTIRIDTYTNDKKIPRIMSSLVRIGAGNSIVDNISSGGMFVGIDITNGKLFAESFSDFTHGGAESFKFHPQTQCKFEGFQIPFYQQAKNLVLKAAKQ